MVSYPIIARMGDSSDVHVFRQIFAFDEYACLRAVRSPSLIFDLGANVGYSSAYFLNCFPTAKVLAVEPDPANYEVCRANLAAYGGRVKLVLGAVWSSRSRLVLSRDGWGDHREWASRVLTGGDSDDASVEGWDITGLLQMAGGQHIDILKVDIERSELEVFGHGSSSWLPKVGNICIELHGADCEEVFFHALRGFDYHLERSGELTVCLNMKRRQDGKGTV